jgi:hypothetical protein
MKIRSIGKTRKVPYSKVKPLSDKLAYYKGKLYGTKEDLKLFPDKVTLEKLPHTNYGDNAYSYYSNEDLMEARYNANPNEKRRITTELKKRGAWQAKLR